MKILLVHNYYQSRLLGGEDKVFQQEKAELIQKLGAHKVFVYTVSNDDLKLWQLPFTILNNRKHGKAIFKLCKEHQIDLVHVHNFFPILTSAIFLEAKRAGCKVVHTLHNYRWWCLNGTLFYKKNICKQCVGTSFAWLGVFRACFRQSILQSLLAALAFHHYKKKKVLEVIDKFFVLSKHQAAQVKDWLPAQKIIIKPNAIHISKMPSHEKKGYVFVGRLESGKGIEEVLQAWEHLPYSLTIIGSGELEQPLKEHYQSNHIHFLGNLPEQQVAKALSQAKYCLHASLYYETFGLVILEAMQLGTPVIGFPIGTRLEFIKDGINGFLVKPEALANLIKKVDNHPEYKALCKSARETAYQYSVDHVIQQQLYHYHSLLRQKT